MHFRDLASICSTSPVGFQLDRAWAARLVDELSCVFGPLWDLKQENASSYQLAQGLLWLRLRQSSGYPIGLSILTVKEAAWHRCATPAIEVWWSEL